MKSTSQMKLHREIVSLVQCIYVCCYIFCLCVHLFSAIFIIRHDYHYKQLFVVHNIPRIIRIWKRSTFTLLPSLQELNYRESYAFLILSTFVTGRHGGASNYFILERSIQHFSTESELNVYVLWNEWKRGILNGNQKEENGKRSFQLILFFPRSLPNNVIWWGKNLDLSSSTLILPWAHISLTPRVRIEVIIRPHFLYFSPF